MRKPQFQTPLVPVVSSGHWYAIAPFKEKGRWGKDVMLGAWAREHVEVLAKAKRAVDNDSALDGLVYTISQRYTE
jgi:hypothetical protein